MEIVFEHIFRKGEEVSLRRSGRHMVEFPIKTAEGEGLNERMLNYSLGGCAFTSPVIFQVGELLSFTLGRLDKIGNIVWSKHGPGGQNEYGLQFAYGFPLRRHPIRERGKKRLMEKIAELYRPFLDGGTAWLLR